MTLISLQRLRKDARRGRRLRVSESTRPSRIVPKVKKKQSTQQAQRDLQKLTRDQAQDRPPVNMSKIYWRVGLLLAVVWAISLIIPSMWPKVTALVVTLIVAGAGIWFVRFTKKSQELGSIVRGADSEEGRKRAARDAG